MTEAGARKISTKNASPNALARPLIGANMSLFYETLTKKENLAFKARKKAFKKGKPCAICGRVYKPEYMMVAHIKPVSEIDDWTALYDQTNWEVRCIGCEREYNREKSENEV